MTYKCHSVTLFLVSVILIDIDAVFSENPVVRNLAKSNKALFALCCSPSFGITLLNWTVVVDYTSFDFGDPDDVERLILDIHLHGVLLAFALIDYSLSLLYMEFTSIIHVACLLMLYLIWSLIHYAAGLTDPFGNEYIYYLLNWKYPQTAIPLSIFSLLGTIGIHCLLSWIKYRFVLHSYVSTSHLKCMSVQERVHSSSNPAKEAGQMDEECPPNDSPDTNGHDQSMRRIIYVILHFVEY